LSSGAAEAKRRELGLEAEGRPQQSAATTGYKCLSIMVIYSINPSATGFKTTSLTTIFLFVCS